MKMRKILALVMALAMMLVCLPMQANAAYVASGTCGDNLTWTLTDTGALTISGTGAMKDYPYSAMPEYLAPWRVFEDQITSVTVENGVTYIGNCAFVYHKNLTSVSIADSVTAMGDSVFSDCEALKSVTIPNSVVSMGKNTFARCYQLENVTLPQGLTTLESNTFRDCYGLKKVIVPAAVNQVGLSAFVGCTQLEEIRFLGNAPTFGEQAFGSVSATVFYNINDPTWTDAVKQEYGGTPMWVGVGNPATDTLDNISGSCGASTTWTLKDGCLTISGTGVVEEVAWKTLKSKIKKVVIEEGVTNIAESSFFRCTDLTEVKIAGSVTEVGGDAFYECTSLKKIVLPGAVTKIEACAFAGCSSLTEIVIPDTVSFIGMMAFQECSSLKKITLPAALTSIEDYLFFNADALQSVVIPYGAKYIGFQAFAGCDKLYSVEIPATVAYIEDRAFASCTNLSSITFRGNAPEFRGNFPFEGVTAYAYYPAGNETWTSSAMATFNAKLTWVAKSGIQQPIPEKPVTWTLENGVLTILSDTEGNPWQDRRSEIEQVVIQDGVTVIGGTWFANCPNLTSVSIPETVTEIQFAAFQESRNIKELVIPASVTWVGSQGLYMCTGLEKITFCGQAPHFEGDFVFLDVKADVYYPNDDGTWTEDVRKNYGGELTWIPYCKTHSYTTVTVEADCITPGTTTHTCSFCGDVQVEPGWIPPQGHDYGLAEDGNPDFWDTTCDVCGAERVVDKHRPTHSMYRMYNPNSGEHFYTGSMTERQNLEAAGWKYEGVGFTFPATTGKPVYRLYDKFGTMEHLYTMDEAEKDQLLAEGWVLEGVAFNSGREDEVPQYRLHNPNATIGAYHFTASVEEKDTLIAAGWEYQGIGFYTCLQ